MNAAQTLPDRRATRRPPWCVWLLVRILIGAGVVLLFTLDDSNNGLRGSGKSAEQRRVVPAFSGVELAGSNLVTVRVGSPRSVHARSLTVTLSGSGVLRASRTADRLDVKLGGSGVAQLRSLTARDARAVVPGSGRIDLTATRTLDGSIPGPARSPTAATQRTSPRASPGPERSRARSRAVRRLPTCRDATR